MLSRTADNLYWIARYMERAETLARFLEVGARIALLPSTGHGYRNEWVSLLQASGTAIGFQRKYGDPVQRNIESYLFFDRDNSSSVASCLIQARENARIVRTALSTQVWDALNTAFQELRDLERVPRGDLELSRLTDWTMRHAAMVRGTIDTTLLRNDGWDFLNLGYHLERADNTARLLDVKYHILLPEGERVGGTVDRDQWTTILQTVSAVNAYRWLYREGLQAKSVCELLILRRELPRSLAASAEEVVLHLNALGKQTGFQGEADRLARLRHARLGETRIDAVMKRGLHQYLEEFLAENAELNAAISRQFRFI